MLGVRGAVSEHERRLISWVRYRRHDLKRDIRERREGGKLAHLPSHHLRIPRKAVQTGVIHDEPHE